MWSSGGRRYPFSLWEITSLRDNSSTESNFAYADFISCSWAINTKTSMSTADRNGDDIKRCLPFQSISLRIPYVLTNRFPHSSHLVPAHSLQNFHSGTWSQHSSRNRPLHAFFRPLLYSSTLCFNSDSMDNGICLLQWSILNSLKYREGLTVCVFWWRGVGKGITDTVSKRDGD